MRTKTFFSFFLCFLCLSSILTFFSIPVYADSEPIAFEGYVPPEHYPSVLALSSGGYDYISNDTVYSAQFKSYSNWGDGVKFSVNDSSLIYQPSDMSYRDVYGSQDYLGSINSVTASVSGANVTYNGVYSNVNLQYVAEYGRLKEYYTVTSLPRTPASWLGANVSLDFGGYIKFGSLKMYCGGVDVSTSSFVTSGRIDFNNPTSNQTVFYLPEPVAIDANGNQTDCRYEVKNQGGQIWFYVRTSYSWLSQAAFPVRVDPTLYEYYNSSSSGNDAIYKDRWGSQTFTVDATSHTITSVKLLLYRVGTIGTVTASIRATDGSGHPTGSDLTSGTTNGNTLTTSSAGEWREITLTEYTLSASTKYAIVIRAPSADNFAGQSLYPKVKSPSAYSGGNVEASSNSGVSWSTQTYDLLFEVYGNALGGGSAENVAVSLDGPSNASTVDSWTQNFTYTPTLVGTSSFQNATLYLNGTAAESNSTALVNATVNGISHTFSENGTYIWGIKVYNSTMGVFADANFTLTVGVTAQSLINASISSSFVLSSSEAARKSIGNSFSGSPVVGVGIFSLKVLGFGSTQVWIFSGADGESKRVYSVTVAGPALSTSEGSRKLISFGFFGVVDLAAQFSALKYLVSAVTTSTLVNDPFSLSSGLSVSKAIYNSVSVYLSGLFSLGGASDFVKSVGTGLLISTPFDVFVPVAGAVCSFVLVPIVEALTVEDAIGVAAALAIIFALIPIGLIFALRRRDGD